MRSHSARLTRWRDSAARVDGRASTRGGENVRRRVSLDLGLAAAVLGLALGTALFRLPGTSLWADEAFSVEFVSSPWPVFWGYLWDREANMVLYHLLLRGWLAITGSLGLTPDELIVRMPSIVFSVLGAVTVYWLGRRFWSRTVGAVGGVLYVLNELALGVARQARSYSLQMLLVCVGWYALFAAITAERRRMWWWSGYVVAMTLALYAHLFSALVLAAQLIAFAVMLLSPSEWRDRARRSVKAMIASVVAICTALIPMVMYAVTRGPSNTHVPPASLMELARLLWNIAGQNLVYGSLLGLAALIAVVVTLRAAPRAVDRERSLPLAPAVALACWLAVPILLAAAATQPGFNLHLFAWPYFVVVVPALCLLAGVGVAALRGAAQRRALALALIAAAAFATPIYASPPAQDFRTAAGWIQEHYRAGDGLICTSWSCSLAMQYYVRLGAVSDGLIDGTPASWSWTNGGVVPLDQRVVVEYVAAHPRVFLVDGMLGGDPVDMKTQARLTQDRLDRDYSLVAEVILRSQSPVSVRLYEAGQPSR
jgi:hypothetical protein